MDRNGWVKITEILITRALLSYKRSISILKYGICPKIIGLIIIDIQVIQNIIPSSGSGTFLPQIILVKTDNKM
jgi:hypothetical protein